MLNLYYTNKFSIIINSNGDKTAITTCLFDLSIIPAMASFSTTSLLQYSDEPFAASAIC